MFRPLFWLLFLHIMSLFGLAMATAEPKVVHEAIAFRKSEHGPLLLENRPCEYVRELLVSKPFVLDLLAVCVQDQFGVTDFGERAEDHGIGSHCMGIVGMMQRDETTFSQVPKIAIFVEDRRIQGPFG